MKQEAKDEDAGGIGAGSLKDLARGMRSRAMAAYATLAEIDNELFGAMLEPILDGKNDDNISRILLDTAKIIDGLDAELATMAGYVSNDTEPAPAGEHALDEDIDEAMATDPDHVNVELPGPMPPELIDWYKDGDTRRFILGALGLGITTNKQIQTMTGWGRSRVNCMFQRLVAERKVQRVRYGEYRLCGKGPPIEPQPDPHEDDKPAPELSENDYRILQAMSTIDENQRPISYGAVKQAIPALRYTDYALALTTLRRIGAIRAPSDTKIDYLPEADLILEKHAGIYSEIDHRVDEEEEEVAANGD